MNNLVLKSYIEEFAELMSSETYSLIKAQSKVNKKNIDRDISTKFIKFFIKKVLLSSLTEMTNKNMTPHAAYKVTKASFLDIKRNIQEEVAKAFEEAILIYSRQQVDYYCDIRVVPEPYNKEMI